MPTHVLQFEAMWSSDKLARCATWAQPEYAWLYGIADVNGSFELTNMRVIWGKVSAIRSGLSIERLEQVFDEFIANGLLFVWAEDGKRYGHWTGCEKPGRLLAPSLRKRYRPFAPEVPKTALKKYLQDINRKVNNPQCNLNEVSRTGVGCRVQGVGLSKNHRANPSASHMPVFPTETQNQDSNDTETPIHTLTVAEKQAAGERRDVAIGEPDEETEAIKRTWAYYVQKLGKSTKLLTLTELRKNKGLARLREALKKTKGELGKAEELMRIAIDNLAASRWHIGENPARKKYDSWERNLFGSTEQFERWLESEAA